jgi:haloacetate dehalogenase
MSTLFRTRRLRVNGVTIHAVMGGSGPPVLLLHGWPQTHAMWHGVAPALARQFTVVCADLRGYGDSSKPRGDSEHANYSKRTMAQDMAEVMTALGHERFHLVGHDRGGRVAHRLARDHGERVRTLTVIDIAPTLAMYQRTDMAYAQAYYHWFLFIQPAPLPETMVQAAGLSGMLGRLAGSTGSATGFFHPRAWAEYQRCFTPAMVHGSCEDYRASAGIDLEHDRADVQAGRKLAMPVQAIWGTRGVVARMFDPLAEWQAVADDVTGLGLNAGHFVPEEATGPTTEAIANFLRSRG